MPKIIQKYIIGRGNSDEVIECDEVGFPVKTEKTKKRKLECNERSLEKNFINSIKGFSYKETSTWKWISQLFGLKNTAYQEVHSLAKFFSMITGLSLHREIYRRKNSIIYWMETNNKEIVRTCTQLNARIVINDRVVPIIPTSHKILPDIREIDVEQQHIEPERDLVQQLNREYPQADVTQIEDSDELNITLPFEEEEIDIFSNIDDFTPFYDF